MRRWSLLLLVLGLALSLGWWSGRRQMAVERMDVRQEILHALADNRAFSQECLNNMKHQFTPGYRCAQVLPDPQHFTLSMEQGKIFRTHTPTDLAIDGNGFFVISHLGETLYTRDGRFSFQDGVLKNLEKSSVLAYPMDPSGKSSRTPQAVELPLDPSTKLYAGRFIGFRFDAAGVLFGQSTDEGEVPLFQLALVGFERPEKLERAGLTSLRGTEAANLIREGVAGQWDLGRVTPASLELSNVNFMEQGMVIQALRQQAGLLGEPMLQQDDARSNLSRLDWPRFQAPTPTSMWTNSTPQSTLPLASGMDPLNKVEADQERAQTF